MDLWKNEIKPSFPSVKAGLRGILDTDMSEDLNPVIGACGYAFGSSIPDEPWRSGLNVVVRPLVLLHDPFSHAGQNHS